MLTTGKINSTLLPFHNINCCYVANKKQNKKLNAFTENVFCRFMKKHSGNKKIEFMYEILLYLAA